MRGDGGIIFTGDFSHKPDQRGNNLTGSLTYDHRQIISIRGVLVPDRSLRFEVGEDNAIVDFLYDANRDTWVGTHNSSALGVRQAYCRLGILAAGVNLSGGHIAFPQGETGEGAEVSASTPGLWTMQ